MQRFLFYIKDLTLEELHSRAEHTDVVVTVNVAVKTTYDVHFNPNGSVMAIEGITSPDGRVFGKMGHSERIGSGLYRNVEGNYDLGMFRGAVKFFK